MNAPTDVKPSPLLHCEKVYFQMREDARQVDEGDVPMLVWEGFLTRLMRDLELAVPYYSTIKSALENMGCMRQLRRGGGTSPSQWELLKEPTLDLWNKMKEAQPSASVPAASAASKGDFKHVKQMVLDLTERLDSVEKNVEFMVELFNEHIKKESA